MAKTYYLKRGNTFHVSSDAAMDLHETLPVANYVVKFDPIQGFYLEGTEDFDVPKKIYGNTEKVAERIVQTFGDRPSTTGVLLCGEKGSGKTLLAKMISKLGKKQNIPTLIVNTPLTGDGFNTFLANIRQPVFLFFDEFEKVYPEDEQQGLLTILDGVFGGKKMYLMTANDKWKINLHMKNRPGRFYYFIEFGSLDHDFIREYGLQNLKNKELTEQICVLSSLFDSFNFDMLQAIVEEVNRYGEEPKDVIELLNVKPTVTERGEYNISLRINDAPVEMVEGYSDLKWTGNPFGGRVQIDYYVKTTKKKPVVPDPDPVPQEHLASRHINLISKIPNIYDEDDEGGEWRRAIFNTSQIVAFDGVKGIIRFKNGKDELVLTKVKEVDFNYRNLL